MADPGRNGDRTDFKVCGTKGLHGRFTRNLITGVMKYETDVVFPNMLFGQILRCPYGHAKIKSMDTGKAEALPGVKAVVRWDDPEMKAMPRFWWSGYSSGGLETCMEDEGRKAECEMGVFVAAETQDIADEAINLIEIEWEQLPHITDPEEAAKPDAPIVMPDQNTESNLWREQEWEDGDVIAGSAEATHIVEYDISFPEMFNVNQPPCSCTSYWQQDPNAEEGPSLYMSGVDMRRRYPEPARRIWNLPNYKMQFLNDQGNSCY